ncbi:hypothetical protein MKW94_022650, partial [Papaver nudicaule]|nr:hypothetical protein [Papaver nudicaule]
IEENDTESEESDTESEENDAEETENEELEEKLYALTVEGKLGLKSVTMNNNEKRKRDYGDDYDSDDYEKENKNIVVYCRSKDGKGWQCRSKAQMGNPFCKHHMIQRQRYLDRQKEYYHQRKIRELKNKKTTSRRIGRPPKGLSDTNTTTTVRGKRNQEKLSAKKSSEFYYYSGFGPLWGGSTKRGRPSNEVKQQQEEENAAEEEALTRQVIIDEALIHSRSPSRSPSSSPSRSPVKTVKEEEKDNDNDNGCMFVDDDFDTATDEDTNGGTKKRFRKRIKAKSLKSFF